MKRRRSIYIFIVFLTIFLFYYCGVSDYAISKDFDTQFDYPLNMDLRPIVANILAGNDPVTTPINYYPYRFQTTSDKCKTVEKLDLFIAVKSAMDHFDHRKAIRQTYGQENNYPGRIIKTLFFLGIGEPGSETQKLIDEEIKKHKDVIQIDFQDNYYNNTIKTMMSFRWVYEHCSTADYYLFTDDDMYISVHSLMNFVYDQPTASNNNKETYYPKAEEAKLLYAGYVFKSKPHRYIASKWRVSIDEYPWNKWPPYITAGAYVVSNKAMKTLYVGSLYVKHFRFDDIYLGIVAKKLHITLTHCSDFYYYKKKYDYVNYNDVIASHGYGDHDELVRVWSEQHKLYTNSINSKL